MVHFPADVECFLAVCGNVIQPNAGKTPGNSLRGALSTLWQIRKCLGGCCDCFGANSFMQIFYIMASVMVGLHQLIFWLRSVLVLYSAIDSWVFTMFQDPPLFCGNKEWNVSPQNCFDSFDSLYLLAFLLCRCVLCHFIYWILELNNWTGIVLIVLDFNHSQVHALLHLKATNISSELIQVTRLHITAVDWIWMFELLNSSSGNTSSCAPGRGA